MLGVLGAVILSSRFPYPGEHRVRIAGFLMTVFDVVLVGKGILETQRLFQRPRIRQRAAAWARRLPDALAGGRVVDVRVAVTGASAVLAAGEVQVVTGDGSLESRIAMLEQQMPRLTADLASACRTFTAEIQGIRTTVEAERAAREQKLREVSERLESYSAGGLDQEFVGVAWVLIGQAMGSFPTEIAQHVRPRVPFW